MEAEDCSRCDKITRKLNAAVNEGEIAKVVDEFTAHIEADHDVIIGIDDDGEEVAVIK